MDTDAGPSGTGLRAITMTTKGALCHMIAQPEQIGLSMTKSLSATVYIWYPHGDNVGHASVYIGDQQKREHIEQSYDTYKNDASKLGLVEEANISYVSWWPMGGAGPFELKPEKHKLFLEQDIEAEGGVKPHVVYKLYDLDVGAMRNKWQEIREKPEAHYHFLRKSCATIALRVLKAGGAVEKMPLLKRGLAYNNVYTTPKNVAQVCNTLRDAGYAEKTKDGANCPAKGSLSFGIRALGLR